MTVMRWIVLCLVFVVAGCSNRTAAPIVPSALSVGTNKTVFVGTTRKQGPEGLFGIERSSLSLLQLQVSIPPQRTPGTISDGLDKPNPMRDFTIADQHLFSTPSAFRNTLRKDIQSDGLTQDEVTIYVHGFNNSFADTAFRIAQLSHDLDLPGPMATYAWPSRGHPLGYEYDADSTLFARDGLLELIDNIQSSGAKKIFLVAHSMGGRLVMEALRQFEIKTPGWSKRHLSGVMLISPDINADVFLSQIKSFKSLPQPFIVFTSTRDVLLRLSAGLRWEDQRLGNIEDISVFADYPINFVDVSAFEDRSSGNHFVAGNSPALIALLKSPQRFDQEFLQGHAGSVGGLPGYRRVLRNATQVVVLPAGER